MPLPPSFEQHGAARCNPSRLGLGQLPPELSQDPAYPVRETQLSGLLRGRETRAMDRNGCSPGGTWAWQVDPTAIRVLSPRKHRPRHHGRNPGGGRPHSARLPDFEAVDGGQARGVAVRIARLNADPSGLPSPGTSPATVGSRPAYGGRRHWDRKRAWYHCHDQSARPRPFVGCALDHGRDPRIQELAGLAVGGGECPELRVIEDCRTHVFSALTRMHGCPEGPGEAPDGLRPARPRVTSWTERLDPSGIPFGTGTR